MSRTVAIIGPGAMGCLFAARLHEAGHKVHLIDHQPARAERLQSSGIKVESAAGALHARPKVSTKLPAHPDLIIVMVKAHTTETLSLDGEAPVLTLQNGLGNAEKLADIVGSSRLLAGAMTEAASCLGEGHVRHAASGWVRFGPWTSCPAEAAEEALSSAGFNVEITDAPGQLIWEKTAINAGINPLSALLDVANGRLLEQTETRQLLRDLVVEAAKVAATEGYRFPYSLVESAEEVCAQSAANISSMLQDIRAGRRTEIEAVSGEIMRRGQLASLPTPRTRVIYQLLKGLENR